MQRLMERVTPAELSQFDAVSALCEETEQVWPDDSECLVKEQEGSGRKKNLALAIKAEREYEQAMRQRCTSPSELRRVLHSEELSSFTPSETLLNTLQVPQKWWHVDSLRTAEGLWHALFSHPKIVKLAMSCASQVLRKYRRHLRKARGHYDELIQEGYERLRKKFRLWRASSGSFLKFARIVMLNAMRNYAKREVRQGIYANAAALKSDLPNVLLWNEGEAVDIVAVIRSEPGGEEFIRHVLDGEPMDHVRKHRFIKRVRARLSAIEPGVCAISCS